MSPDQVGLKSNSHFWEKFGGQMRCWTSEQKWFVGQCALQIQPYCYLPKPESLGMEGSDWAWKQSHSFHPSKACWTHYLLESSIHQPLIQEPHRSSSSQLIYSHSKQNCNNNKTQTCYFPAIITRCLIKLKKKKSLVLDMQVNQKEKVKLSESNSTCGCSCVYFIPEHFWVFSKNWEKFVRAWIWIGC